MTPQERDLITSLLNRLQQAANQPKDREAEALIAQGIAAQPDAPYLLVQTVLIEDMALSEAHNRIKDLEQQLAAAQSAAQQQPTSFLGAARGSVPSAGPWGRPAPAAAPASGPVWTQSGVAPAAAAAVPAMAPLAAPGASSGFLRQAATTAAGIAGGALLFEGISSLFGPHYGNMLGGMPAQPGIGETVINNYYGDNPPADPGSDPGLSQASLDQDPGGQDYASDQDAGSDQDFGDSGGGSFDV
jgi:uncharacterized protein